jgi:predicted lipoprotein with Yx(FWY)xxD motif
VTGDYRLIRATIGIAGALLCGIALAQPGDPANLPRDEATRRNAQTSSQVRQAPQMPAGGANAAAAASPSTAPAGGGKSSAASVPADNAAPVVGRIFESTAAPAAEAAPAPIVAPDSRDPAVMDRGLLVDRRGMTLYTFDGDRRPRVSTCYGICETLWPPLYAGIDDKSHGDFAIIHRRDGSVQWAYQGKPLYYWKRDSKPGDITGDKVNNVWHVVRDPALAAQ